MSEALAMFGHAHPVLAVWLAFGLMAGLTLALLIHATASLWKTYLDSKRAWDERAKTGAL